MVSNAIGSALLPAAVRGSRDLFDGLAARADLEEHDALVAVLIAQHDLQRLARQVPLDRAVEPLNRRHQLAVEPMDVLARADACELGRRRWPDLLDLDAELRLHLVARKHQPNHSESAVQRRAGALCKL